MRYPAVGDLFIIIIIIVVAAADDDAVENAFG